jgi:hypothetical protein
LHRWGYRRYRELSNPRKLLALELSCRRIAALGDARLRHTLATNLLDLLHPVGLVHCESNFVGIRNGNIGGGSSGGWVNIIDRYTKVKRYCGAPFETRHVGKRKVPFPIEGEWIGEKLNGSRKRGIGLHCTNASGTDLPEASLDTVLSCATAPGLRNAFERIEELDAHRLIYHLPKPGPDGRTQLVLSPLEPVSRQVPPPGLSPTHPIWPCTTLCGAFATVGSIPAVLLCDLGHCFSHDSPDAQRSATEVGSHHVLRPATSGIIVGTTCRPFFR